LKGACVEQIPIIVGPTGIGKSALAMELAQELNGEIVSCDSRQIYRGMSIGTAKPSQEELDLVPHHMINIIEPSEEYGAGRWAIEADTIIHDIISRGKLPIICGGTFFYFSALRDGFDITTPPDHEFRKSALEREDSGGEGTLHTELEMINPVRASEIHPRDIHRTIRALQIENDGSGTVQKSADHSFYMIELTAPRDVLYDRINRRVLKMVEQGLFDEFQNLLNSGLTEESPGLKCVGYREFFNYIEQRESFDTVISQIQQSSRKYAKRQLTWLRNRETSQYKIEIDTISKSIPDLIQKLRP